MAKKPATIQGEKRCKTVLSIVFAVVAIVYLLPIFLVLMNSFKANAYVNTETFAQTKNPLLALTTMSRA